MGIKVAKTLDGLALIYFLTYSEPTILNWTQLECPVTNILNHGNNLFL